MIELLTVGKSESGPEMLFHWSADDAEIGSDTITDSVTGRLLTAKLADGVSVQPGYTNTVITHVKYGKVMSLGGNKFHYGTWFRPPVVPVGKKLVFEITMAHTVPGQAQTYAFCTGGLDGGTATLPGFMLSVPNSTTTTMSGAYAEGTTGTSGVSSNVPYAADLQTHYFEQSGDNRLSFGTRGLPGMGGPFGFQTTACSGIFVFCRPADRRGNINFKGLYGYLKEVKVQLV